MKATGICIMNAAEIQKVAERNIRLELENPIPLPEAKQGAYELHFDKTRVESFYKTSEGYIMVHLHSGKFYAIQHTDEIWKELMQYTQ